MASQKRQREIERRRAAGITDRSAYLTGRARQREDAAYLRTLGFSHVEIAEAMGLRSADAARKLATRANSTLVAQQGPPWWLTPDNDDG